VSDIPAELSAALAQRYALERPIGRGGMATVYLARDGKHRREVALKVLRPDLAASIGTDRFLQEIQIAARLTHPHILALHDSGEAAGFLYYVMPYIDGPSLRWRLEHEGRFAVSEVLRITAAVADALGYAHRMGVFHRDIKPENILFSQGHPIVTDFGIAKAISTAGGANLTRTGFPLGTPGYMSPEQAAGLTDLDERTDVYSLAAVTYEMVVGDIPRGWPSEDEVRAGRFLGAPTDHRARLAQAGTQIEGALVRGLAIRHDERTPTPAALVADLRGAAPARRRYSNTEVKDIVNRAAEMEVSNPTTSGAMTIGGVEAIAADVGIPAELVRSAAGAVEPRAASLTALTMPKPNRFIGGPTRLLYERLVDGEVPDAEFPIIVDEIRRLLGNVGQVSQLGRSFSWSTARGAGGGREIEVAVVVRGGQTRITIQERLGNLIGGIFGGIGGGMGGGGMGPIMGILFGGMHAPGVLAAVIVPLWLGLTYSIARTTYHYNAKRRTGELAQLADRLEALARQLVPPRGELGPGPKLLG
jgi:hypothetical protein